jgi:hypothetical protein
MQKAQVKLYQCLQLLPRCAAQPRLLSLWLHRLGQNLAKSKERSECKILLNWVFKHLPSIQQNFLLFGVIRHQTHRGEGKTRSMGSQLEENYP